MNTAPLVALSSNASHLAPAAAFRGSSSGRAHHGLLLLDGRRRGSAPGGSRGAPETGSQDPGTRPGLPTYLYNYVTILLH
jgi:hypothetical protein